MAINMGTGGKRRGKNLWLDLVTSQQQWVAEHGGDLAGYIDRYTGRYGRTVENATAIYQADIDALKRYEAHLANYR
jgi:hypothetical protein